MVHKYLSESITTETIVPVYTIVKMNITSQFQAFGRDSKLIEKTRLQTISIHSTHTHRHPYSETQKGPGLFADR